MDIKTADRLQELRKANGYSQEALAEKLGLSRQAISKWERGESSPDTDNLIALAQLYGVTLDQIVNPNSDMKSPEKNKKEKKEKKEKEKGLYQSIANGMFKFPVPLFLVGAYVVLNLFLHLWHPMWLLFFLIPIYYHFAGACCAKTKKGFLFALPIPEIIVLIYLCLGFALSLWGAGAVLFIIIPIYYWSVAFYKKK